MKIKFDLWSLDDLFGIIRGPDQFYEEEVEFVSSFKGTKRHPEINKAISEGRMGMKFTDKHRENLSLSHRGKRKPLTEETKKRISDSNKGRKRNSKQKALISEKTRESMKKLNQQTYKFTSPSGEVFSETTTLAEFARKHNLNKSLLSLVLNGKRKHHKGWKVVFHTPVEN